MNQLLKPPLQPHVSITGDRVGTGDRIVGLGQRGLSQASVACVCDTELAVGALKRAFVLGVGVFSGASSCVVGPCGALVLVLKV